MAATAEREARAQSGLAGGTQEADVGAKVLRGLAGLLLGWRGERKLDGRVDVWESELAGGPVQPSPVGSDRGPAVDGHPPALALASGKASSRRLLDVGPGTFVAIISHDEDGG